MIDCEPLRFLPTPRQRAAAPLPPSPSLPLCGPPLGPRQRAAMPPVCLFVYLFVCLFVCLFCSACFVCLVGLVVCFFVCRFVCLFVCVCVCVIIYSRSPSRLDPGRSRTTRRLTDPSCHIHCSTGIPMGARILRGRASSLGHTNKDPFLKFYPHRNF